MPRLHLRLGETSASEKEKEKERTKETTGLLRKARPGFCPILTRSKNYPY
jgi:hypothetical protein